MSTELRIYRVIDGRLDEWVECWRTKVGPLLERFGFRIDATWIVREQNTFIYLLSYDGPGKFDTRNQEYANSPERAELGVDPSTYLESTERFPLETV